LWFVEQSSNQIGSFNPSSQTFAEYTIPSAKAFPQDLALDDEGNVWFTELTPGKLGELTPSSGNIIETNIPAGPGDIPCGPVGVTVAKDGTVWTTCEFSNQIDEYFPQNGTFTGYDLPVVYSAPVQILFDGEGNLWFTASDAGMLGFAVTSQLRSGTSDGISEFAPLNQTYVITIDNSLLPSGHVRTSISVPSRMAFSPDGNSIWVTDHASGSFDRYDIGTKTLVRYFTSRPPPGSYEDSLPNGIAVDSAGDVWIAEHYGNRIAELNPSTGSLTEYPIPCCQSEIAGSLYLTLGTGGAVWFTEYFGNSIGALVPVTGWTSPLTRLTPSSVTLDPTDNSSVNVEVSSGAGNETVSGSVAFALSGITWDGKLQNLTANFEPPTLTLGQNETATTTLHLQTKNLSPGIYLLNVGATSSATGVTSGRVLELIVKSPAGSTTLWLAAGGFALAVAGVCAVLLARRRRSVAGEYSAS
jgi:streptogramin lyase